MKTTLLFPGQGSQFLGMAKELYESFELAKNRIEQAKQILDFDISEIMFGNDFEKLVQTEITQPAIFLHSIILLELLKESVSYEMVAGHSLGEFTALVACQSISFEDGLTLVRDRARAMQEACVEHPGTMVAVLGLNEPVVEEICATISGTVLVANYNCPGQLVISGEKEAVMKAIDKLNDAGAKRVVQLPVKGGFHSPLMQTASEKLTRTIKKINFHAPTCPIYQNVCAIPVAEIEEIKSNLIKQLTAPVLWSQTIRNMVADGTTRFIEVGPKNILTNLNRRIFKSKSIISTHAESLIFSLS